MRRLARGIWRVLMLPLRIAGRVVAFPARAFASIRAFLLTEPEEHSLTDVFSDLAQNQQARQLFWDQVEALRAHLLRAVLAIVAAVGVSFAFTERFVEFLAVPVGGLNELRAIEVTESISVFMKVALLAGISIALPYVAFEFWLFAAPGLRPRERLYGIVGIPLAAVFFLGGMAFTYYILLPNALPFLLSVLGIQAELRPQSYFSFVTGLMFWIGLAFEFPLVIFVLTSMGFVKPHILRGQWRLAMLIIAILAAAVTPTVDPVNMGLVMLPMIVLYFVSIGLSYLASASRSPKKSDDTVQEDQ